MSTSGELAAGELDPSSRAERVDRLQDEIVERPHLALRRSGARLEARQIEEVGDEPVQAARLELDRLEQVVAVVVGEAERPVAQSADGGRDAGQRRAEIV